MSQPFARPRVLVLGGGFGGLTAAQALAKARVDVILVDRTNHHTFQPLLYQVATAGLSPAEIAQPIRAIVRKQPNVTVLMAEAVRVDLDAKQIHFEDGAIRSWDFLVLACGAETSYFGHEEWRDVAPGLKSIEDAVAIRQRVLVAFELAEREEDADQREKLLTFVVIGGGPTGVELAGALAELSKFVLRRDFRRIDPAATRIQLLEAGPRILPSFPEDLSQSAVLQLHELGVEVRTGALVTSIEPGRVHLGAESIESAVVLWAAGVRANPLTRTLGAPVDKAGRILVERDLRVPGHPEVFVVGDAAHLDGANGEPLPGVGPVAMQQARAAARSIRRVLGGKDPLPFRYLDKGSLATIGRSRAIGMVDRMHLSGFIAWLAWLVVHIFYLIGFKNRLVVLFIWAWSYVTYDRGARLVIDYAPPKRGVEAPGLNAGGPSDDAPRQPAGSPPPPTPTKPANRTAPVRA